MRLSWNSQKNHCISVKNVIIVMLISLQVISPLSGSYNEPMNRSGRMNLDIFKRVNRETY